jgi:hypothetical protein
VSAGYPPGVEDLRDAWPGWIAERTVDGRWHAVLRPELARPAAWAAGGVVPPAELWADSLEGLAEELAAWEASWSAYRGSR